MIREGEVVGRFLKIHDCKCRPRLPYDEAILGDLVRSYDSGSRLLARRRRRIEQLQLITLAETRARRAPASML